MRQVVGAMLVWTASAYGAVAQDGQSLEPPITYAEGCGYRILLADSVKGPVVTVTRRGTALGTTKDANLAHKSRRFFFKLRTASTLIEFQGRASAAALDGMLSDEHGTRHVTLPIAKGASDTCEELR